MLLVLQHHLEEAYRFPGGKYPGADFLLGHISYGGKCPGADVIRGQMSRGTCPEGADVGADVLVWQMPGRQTSSWHVS